MGEGMHGLKVRAKGSKLPRTWLAIAKVRLQGAPLVGGEHAVQILGKELPGLLAVHYSTPLMADRSWPRALAILDLTVPIGQPVMCEISSYEKPSTSLRTITDLASAGSAWMAA